MDSAANDNNDVEDILNDALELIDEEAAKDAHIAEEGRVQYGDLILRVAPKEGKALTLLADQLFSPSLVLAERIERRLIKLSGRSVLELGAGCAVPSLLSATLPPADAPSLVVITDYPDPDIISNLRGNVEANRARVTEGCEVYAEGYEWGDVNAARKLRAYLPPSSMGFDTLILSDLLHFDTSHSLLLDAVCTLLAPRQAQDETILREGGSHARNAIPQILLAAGRYTPPSVCADFLRLGEKRGLKWTEIPLHDADSNIHTWYGTPHVSHPLGRVLTAEELAARKEMCRYWIGEWA